MTSSENMIERVARAIAKARDYRGYDEIGGKPAWRMYENDAVAAIEAMMAPDKRVLKTGSDEIAGWTGERLRHGEVLEIWQAMLRTSLTGDTK